MSRCGRCHQTFVDSFVTAGHICEKQRKVAVLQRGVPQGDPVLEAGLLVGRNQSSIGVEEDVLWCLQVTPGPFDGSEGTVSLTRQRDVIAGINDFQELL